MRASFSDRAIRTLIGTVALFACAQSPSLSGGTFVLSADGITVYDATNNITWLADFNLPASNRFGVPVCNGTNVGVRTCINPSGSMNYGAAVAWVAAMNAANYLGHSNWQLPTTPLVDNTCGKPARTVRLSASAARRARSTRFTTA